MIIYQVNEYYRDNDGYDAYRPSDLYVRKEAAQVEADRLNADIEDRTRTAHTRMLAEHQKRTQEWDALVAAGLREGEFRAPKPVLYLTTPFSVEEVEVIE